MRTSIDDVKAYVDEVRPRLEAVGIPFTDWAWVGSTFICDEGADIDVIVLTLGGKIHEQDWAALGFVYGGSSPHGCGDNWASIKDAMGHNIILITDHDYFDKWETAALVCKFVHSNFAPLDKQARVQIHGLIMDGILV